MKKIVLVLLAIGLISCEKVITYDLPTEDPQLAVTTKIFTNDSILALASISSPALTPKTNISGDAKLELYEDGAYLEDMIRRDAGFNIDGSRLYFYTSSYNCKAGKTYKIVASQNGYNTVEGATSVPFAPYITDAKIDVNTREVTATLHDPRGLGDVYKIEIAPNYPDETGQWFFSTDLTMEFFEFADDFLDVDGEGKSGSRAYLRDELFDGKRKKIKLTLPEWNFEPSGTYYLVISSLSNSQYQFEKNMDILIYSDAGPFSEPISVYSNMSNGKGNIGAITKASFLIAR